MTANATNAQPAQVVLETKTLGVSKLISFSSVSDAADYAISLITAGTAIPKSIKLGDEVVMSEADINLYWESSR